MVGTGNILGLTKHLVVLEKFSHYWMPLGKQVTIVGGGLVGLELAEFLAERGRKVTVIEEGRDLGKELSIVRRWRVLDHVRDLGVTLVNNAQVTSVDKKAVHYQTDEGEQSVNSDTVVMAKGISTDSTLANALTAAGFTVTAVGDGQEVGYIEGAIDSGYRAGLAC